VFNNLQTPEQVVPDTEKFNTLRRLNFFHNFSDVDIWQVLHISNWHRIPAGTTLIREGDLGTSEEYLTIALDQIDRMSRLILELLDVSRIETGRLEIRREPIPWSSFVRDVVHRHHTAVSDRRFHVNVPNDVRMVSGDRDRLEQVLGNLLENAVKYSPDGSDVYVSVEDRGDQIVTSICDRGIALPPGTRSAATRPRGSLAGPANTLKSQSATRSATSTSSSGMRRSGLSDA